MQFRRHSNIEGMHAYLGASKYSWLNYDEDHLVEAYKRYLATMRGTIIHDFACKCIKLNQKLPKEPKTLNMYVNDAIGFKMTPEQPLYFSENCFGTTDAICFRDNMLRIHDLKTGEIKAHMQQLYIYAALFCLEYDIRPGDIEIETRIYQNNNVVIEHPTADDILPIMDKIQRFDKVISKLKEDEDA